MFSPFGMRFLSHYSWSRLGLPLACFVGGILLGLILAPKPGPVASAPIPADVPIIPPPSWAEITAPDPDTFARNLRKIGCPEETIARIIPMDASPSVPPTQPREVTVIPPASPVLGERSTPKAPPGDIAEPGEESEAPPIIAPEGNVRIPVAFFSSPDDAKLPDRLRSVLNSIQEQFVREIGTENPDPSSPEYRQRWHWAQMDADNRFRAAFGQQAFLKRQIEAVRAEGASLGTEE